MRILLWANRNIVPCLKRTAGPTNGLFRSHVPAAGLTSISDPEYASRQPHRMKPYNYEKRPIFHPQIFTNKTVNRLDENSKLIIIEGNIGIDKETFAKKIAEEFGMKFIPEFKEEECLLTSRGFDRRELNDRVSDKLKVWDFEMLYSTENPRDACHFLRTQIELYIGKFERYREAVSHIWNTGQGVVMIRSVFSDLVFAKALRRAGVLTPKGYQHYTRIYYNTQVELISPHLFLYLDAPVEYCMEQIKKRGRPWEVNSTILTERFLQDVQNIYQADVLPQFKDLSEMKTFDMTSPLDYELIFEDLNETSLDGPKINEDNKFIEWEPPFNVDMSLIRYRYGKRFKSHWDVMFAEIGVPADIDELNYGSVDMEELEAEILQHPGYKFKDYYNPQTQTW
ncbi:NADH dehydrogenase [ubiquinone] 1 alpha subcomplex subunit 10, mitochondrial-like [Mizuhopecten yessoensis]|uniref:NADH dehydrogenase [ubiquinone] 1 alpha subcomplex subunit 10, mitochondrial n=1 Tax=Mizuhopecten yessoensis TaxID=6573 RepID=A0A210R282_MIZYE|nr:NADH dehydrogenase [ubiquinone] 1 alpha subcomplex subunit 10, mitochondrial-like [Mizuhopecten yessoensis]OWF55026.1 NADH dehydrogenase [ubiquinone] 1 alpha subcomplex subunit 10, mitochondrial [Mizuhopecten yessoensis]